MRPRRRRMAKGTLTRIRHTKQVIRQLRAYVHATHSGDNCTPKGMYVSTVKDNNATFHTDVNECPDIVKAHMTAVSMLFHVLSKNTNLIKLKSNRQYFSEYVLNISEAGVTQCVQ